MQSWKWEVWSLSNNNNAILEDVTQNINFFFHNSNEIKHCIKSFFLYQLDLKQKK